jgi:hypothetical protein
MKLLIFPSTKKEESKLEKLLKRSLLAQIPKIHKLFLNEEKQKGKNNDKT